MNRSDLSSVITRYILGQLSQEERARLEEEYFANSDLFEEIVAAENDLIDAYVAGKLRGDDLLQFENHFLTTAERRERVAFARSLLKGKSAENPSRGSTLQTVPANWRFLSLFSVGRAVAAAVILVLLASSLWLAVKGVRLGRELKEIRSSQARLEQQRQELQQKTAELEAQLAQRQAPPTPRYRPQTGEPIIALTLSANMPRGHAKPNILPLSHEISSVVLMLETQSGPFVNYEIALETPEGTPVLRKKGLTSWASVQGRLVEVQLPAYILQRGDYVIRLMDQRGHEVDAYSFRVVTR